MFPHVKPSSEVRFWPTRRISWGIVTSVLVVVHVDGAKRGSELTTESVGHRGSPQIVGLVFCKER